MKRFIVLLSFLFCFVSYAQTETTKWYVNGELYATTSCESGGDIDVPTSPENFGYNFEGWESAIYDMSTLDATINGTSTSREGNMVRITFSYGTVYGEALCSPTNNKEWLVNSVLDTLTGVGPYCYCRITGFIPINSNKIYEPLASPWIFYRNCYDNASNCANNCSLHCYTGIGGNTSFREKLFNIN